MTKVKKAGPVKKAKVPAAASRPSELTLGGLKGEVDELRGDLRRICDLLAAGNLDGVKFKEILDKKQGG